MDHTPKEFNKNKHFDKMLIKFRLNALILLWKRLDQAIIEVSEKILEIK